MANIVTTLKLDTASVVAAILHDTVEDTDVTIDDIESDFGAEGYLVDGLTKINKIKFRSKQRNWPRTFVR